MKRKQSGGEIPSAAQTKALVRQYCTALGQENFQNVLNLARELGVLTPVNRRRKRLMCMQLATKVVLDLLEDTIRVDDV